MSDGLCVEHLDAVGAEALAADTAVAAFLIADLRSRLEQLERRLLSYERTRDYQFAAERTEADTSAWTDAAHSRSATNTRSPGTAGHALEDDQRLEEEANRF